MNLKNELEQWRKKQFFFCSYRTEKAIIFHNIIHAVKATKVVFKQ